MRSRKSTFVALALVIFLAPALRAQELFNGNQTGLPPFGSFHGTDFENVSLANGNLHVEIPIQTVPQRVIKPARIMYVYDAVAWNIYWIPVDPGDPLAPGYYVINNPQAHKDGWRLGDDAGVSAYGYDMTQVLCTAKTPNFNYTLFSNYTLKQSNGTKHGVPLRKEGSGAPANCLGEILSGPTTDGTGYVATIAPGSPNITKILDKDGLVPTAGIDNNGNQVNTVDTLGRALLTPYDAPNITYTTLLNNTIQGPAYSTWTIKDSSGTSRIYRIDYVARDIQSNFCSIYPLTSYHCFEAGPLVVLLPAKLTLPSIGGPDRFYQFTWDNGAAASGLGNLTRIDLPTGGYIAYTYSSALFKTPFSGRYPPYSGRGSVTQRTVYDGAQSNTWLYSISSLGLGATVTRPSYNGVQDQEVHTLTGSVSGLTVGSTVESNVQYYAGSSASGTLLRTVTKDYLAEREPNTGHAANVRQIRETTTLENALVSKVETDYETFTYTALSTTGYCNPCTATRLNVSERREYAYGSGAAGALARKTDYGYLHSGNQPYIDRNIVSRVKLVSVYDGSGVLKAQTQSDYDIYNYSDMGAMQPSNAVQHDATNYGTSFIYRGNVTATKKWRNTDAAWLETRRQFDDAGNIIKTRDPLSHFTTFDYTDNWANSACAPVGQGKAYPKSVTNAMNQITLYSYNSCTGTVASATDPNNQATTFTYDFMDRPDITNFPDGGQVDNDYDDTNRVVTVKRKLTAGATIYSKASYDLLGRITQSQLCEDGTSSCANSIKTDTGYDSTGRQATLSNPYRTTSESTYGISTSIFEALGRVITAIPSDGTQTSNNVSTVYAGNCVTVTDQAGKKRKSCSDALGRLIQVFEPDSAGNFIYETDYQYDTLDNLTRVDQKGNDANSANWRTRIFTYNSLSQLLTANNPESGTLTYTYFDDGTLHTKLDARNITTTYAYDALHRLTGKTYSNSDPAVSYTYDQAACLGQPSCYNIGRRTSMTDAAGSEAWSYDKMGRVLTDQRTTNSVTKNTIYAYNLDGSLATLTYPSTRVVTYSYDSTARAISAIDSTGPINYALSASYAPQGSLAYFQNGASLKSTYIFNNRLQPCWMYSTTGTALPTATLCNGTASAATDLDLKYCFNSNMSDADRAAHNCTASATLNNGNAAQIVNNRITGRTHNFKYDELNRIQSAYTEATTGTYCWGETFGYDIWANLLTIGAATGYTGCTQESGLTITATTKNQISGDGYDLAGNLTTATGFTGLSYNAENQLATASGVTYTYDGDGKRVKKSSGTIYWYGMGSDPLDETDLTGVTTNTAFKEYVLFGGKRIARRDYLNNVNYYFADHLGTARVVTNSSGTILDDSDFYPFGGERVITSSSGNRYKFTSKERDSESGLDNFGARYFASTVGRFIIPDWSVTPTSIPAAEFNNPQSLNLYAYVRNNPIMKIDPDGHDVQVDDDAALKRIKSTLPKKVQEAVKLDKDRKVDKSILNIKSSDPNVKALQNLVKNSGTLEIKTASSVQMGKYGKQDFFFQSAADHVAELKSKGITVDPKTAIDQLFLGKTDDATTTGQGQNVLVTISDGTGKASTAPGGDLAVTTAHEMYGHGLLQLQGKDWKHDDHGPVDAAILEIERNTRKIYEENQQ